MQLCYNLDKDLTRITRPDGQTVDFDYTAAGKTGKKGSPISQPGSIADTIFCQAYQHVGQVEEVK